MNKKPSARPARPAGPPRTQTAAAQADEGSDGRVTLEMVAAAAGVSPSTVSRILNGTAVVSADKRKSVDETVARLGFVPNPVARGLAGGRSLSVGVITQAIDSPFYGLALLGIEDELSRAGYIPLFVSGHWNAEQEARCIETLRARRVDGIIVLTGRLPDAQLVALARRMPVVVTGRELHAPSLYALSFDNHEGGRLATNHLLQLGHRRIAFIAGDARHPDANQRLSGYCSALQAAGVAYRPELMMPGLYSEESGRMAVDRLLDSREPFTAIFAANDQMAYGAALALYRRSMFVPVDVSLVGFDDLSTAQYMLPPLSTVHHPVFELGLSAAQAMLQLLAGEPATAALPSPRFIVRESTRALPG